MDSILLYKPGSIIAIEINTKQRVAIQSANNLAPVIDLQFPVRELYARLVGRWIVECRENILYLRENDSTRADDCIVVSFQEDNVDTKMICDSTSGVISQCFNNTKRIDVYPREVGKIKIQTNEENLPSIEIGTSINDRLRTPYTDISDLQLVDKLKLQLEREREISSSLKEILDSRLEDTITMASEKTHLLTSNGQEKIRIYNSLISEQVRLNEDDENISKLIDNATADLEKKKSEIEQKCSELKVLQEKLDEIEEQKELAELDCDAAKKKLEELKARISLDTDSVLLLENGGRLKHGSVSNSLQQMEVEIEKIEKKIAFTIKYQTQFDQIVEDAILNGDGTILTTDEVGGNIYGDGSRTPTED